MDNIVLLLTRSSGKKILIPFNRILYIEDSTVDDLRIVALNYEYMPQIKVKESLEQIEGWLRSCSLRGIK
jgi:hypothetical protein